MDHSHKTGAIRASLHRGCNSLLGRVENNAARYGVDVLAFSAGLGEYLAFHQVNRTGLIHPTFHSVEEKATRRKEKAKKARQKAKATTQSKKST